MNLKKISIIPLYAGISDIVEYLIYIETLEVRIIHENVVRHFRDVVPIDVRNLCRLYLVVRSSPLVMHLLVNIPHEVNSLTIKGRMAKSKTNFYRTIMRTLILSGNLRKIIYNHLVDTELETWRRYF